MTGSSDAHAAGRARRGELGSTLLLEGIALARAGGPDAVTIRDVQRRPGVSHSAAYRHFTDRDALLDAVAAHASTSLASAMSAATEGAPGGESTSPLGRLRALGQGYLYYAIAEPGLYACVIRYPQMADADDAGRAAPGPFDLLTACLDEMVATGEMDPAARPGSDIAVWAAVHGLASLLIDGPLGMLDQRARREATDRVLEMAVDGIAQRYT